VFASNVKQKVAHEGLAQTSGSRVARQTFAVRIVVEHFFDRLEWALYRNQHWQGFHRRLVFALLLLAFALTASSCRKKKTRVPAPPPVTTPGEEVGFASWYGHPYHGRRTANGEVYDMEKFTAAHRVRPFDSWVRVHNLDSGAAVDVRINDRGPFIDGRIIDLSKAAARAIEMIGPGTALVRVEEIEAPPLESGAEVPLFGVQAGAFAVVDNAERLSGELNERYGKSYVVMRDRDPPDWQVIVGEFFSHGEAEALAQKIRSEYGAAFVIRLGDAETQ
jgi:rare lipoprotein A